MATETELLERIQSLQDECEHLKKINKTLMNRFGQIADGTDSPFAIFETNLQHNKSTNEHTSQLIQINDILHHEIHEQKKVENNLKLNHSLLEKQVKNRTEELSATILKLENEMVERKWIEEALRDSEKKYRELVEYANSIILRVDFKGVCTFFNEYGQLFFGFTEAEMIGKKVTDTIIPQIESETKISLQVFMRDIFRHPEEHLYVESETIKKSGQRVWIAWNNRAIYDKVRKQHQILCVGTDITARKKADEALKSSERKYRFLFENSPAGSIIVGSDGLIKDINKSFLYNLGYGREDLIGKHALQFVVPEQQLIVTERIKSFFNNEQLNEIDIGIIAKDKTLHITRFSGKASVIFEDGLPTGILLNGVDVTRRLYFEEIYRQQQQKLVQTDKMATLGILVSGVAHEINNPNNFILLNSNNLNDVWKDVVPILDSRSSEKGDFTVAGLPYSEIRDDIAPLINGITDGAVRIQRIVQSLKDFSRKDSGDLNECVNINSVIETSILILNNLIKKSTDHFSVNYSDKNPIVQGNFQQIEQVVINLITNACQALTGASQAITISIYVKTDSVIIEIKDEGKGIAPENINHIMDPFFTTKRDTGGTGLGLSISYSIVKDHHGDIQFESVFGNGTTARVILPIFKQGY